MAARVFAVVVLIAAGMFGWVLLSPFAPVTPVESPARESAATAPTVAAAPPARGSSLAEIALPEPVQGPAPVEADSMAPLLMQLPDAIRATVPPLTVNAHFWSRDPARRFIVLNMARYRDGDAVRDGLRVVRVLPDGAELDWRGTRFRVSAQ